eukprot:COSAG01_NODE_3231_length_6380_cov_50.310142_1_plen_110_part_00
MRQWENYCDAAHIGCWAQAWKVTQRKIGGVTVCVMPALAQTLQAADQFRSARAVDHRYWTPQVRISDLGRELAGHQPRAHRHSAPTPEDLMILQHMRVMDTQIVEVAVL